MRRLLRLTVTLIVCALTVELAYRALSGVTVFTLTDWRDTRARAQEANLQGIVRYDPLLGWTVIPGVTSNWINTIDFGIRKNNLDETTLRTGGVLVVGNSFAAGSQVNDDQTMPAYLETLLDQPVINAAIGGYGVDQMVLRAEQLLPAVKPSIVVAAIQFDSIIVNTYRTYDSPKPYFEVDNGELVHRNNPVPRRETPSDVHGFLTASTRNWLGFSYAADRVAMRFAPTWWMTDDTKGRFVTVDNDGVEISCRLLGRLRDGLHARGIRLLVFLQENGQLTALPDAAPPPQIQGVLTCAREQGIQAIDAFDELRPIAVRSRADLEALFVMGEGENAFGHMSPAGNRMMATMIARALRDGPGEPRPDAQRTTVAY